MLVGERRTGIVRAVLSLFMATVCVLPLQAKISATQMSRIIEDSKILGSDKEVRAEVHDKDREAVITTIRNPKATDKDCKIDAVLVARKIMDSDPGGIAKVRVVFYDGSNTNNYRQVTVREGDVKAFASRQISQDTLLAEIELVEGQVNPVERFKGRSYKDISQSLEVLPGIYHGERMQLLGQISALLEKGVGVGPFLAQFFQIEDKVRQGDDAGVIKGLETLTAKVNQQTDQYNKLQEQKRLQRAQSAHPGAAAGAPAASAAPLDRAGQVHQELGDFAPAEGPMFQRRYRVARKVADLKDMGQPIAPYQRLLREVESLAATGNLAALRARLRWAEHLLGLPSYEQED